MTFRTSSERFFIGAVSLNLYRFASASKYIFEMPSFLTLPHPDAVMPPSAIEIVGFGMISAGSTRSCVPRPVHFGQAPYGLLKEKRRGVSSSMETPQSSQA
jgi:hypothetical protein